MTKRITALLLAVLLPIAFILTGCGSKELTVQEYSDQLYSTFKQYSDDLRNIGSLETNVGVSELQSQLNKAKELCETAEQTLDSFINMSPPSQFADNHKKLTAAVEDEKSFLQAVEKIFTSASADELSKNTQEAETFYDKIPEEQQFASIFLELFLEVQSALEDQAP